MKLLVLGGTQFLGRHVVDGALARGHDVTIFTRGRNAVPWGGAVTRLEGNRDPDIAPGLRALAEGEWDVVIDTSTCLPRLAKAAVDSLVGRVARYLFVSSVSVYADASKPDVDENARVAEQADPASEDIAAHYGALKASCEREVQAAFGERSLIVRPGLIVGPHDPTDRFGYWVARFLRPELLGDRGAIAAVPAPAHRPIQFIDVRDLAAWMLDLAETRTSGVFNACSPPHRWTMGALVDALGERSRHSGAAISPRWIGEEALLAAKIRPWVELPLWIPETDREMAGFMAIKCARALAHGLLLRPLEQTLDDTADWLATRDNVGAWRNVLSAQKEQALLRQVVAGDGA